MKIRHFCRYVDGVSHVNSKIRRALTVCRVMACRAYLPSCFEGSPWFFKMPLIWNTRAQKGLTWFFKNQVELIPRDSKAKKDAHITNTYRAVQFGYFYTPKGNKCKNKTYFHDYPRSAITFVYYLCISIGLTSLLCKLWGVGHDIDLGPSRALDSCISS